MDKKVIVIGKNYSTSLGVIRALGYQGYSVEVLELVKGKPFIKPVDLFSKYVCRYEYAYVSGENALKEVLIKQFAEQDNKKLIITADDVSAAEIDKEYDVLKRFFYLPSCRMGGGFLFNMMDKACQKKFAEESGFPVARGWTVEISEDGKYSIPNSICYPCFTKPQLSAGASKSWMKKCESSLELESVLSEIAHSGGRTILIEEYLDIYNEFVVPGMGYQTDAVVPALIKKIKIGSGSHKGVTKIGKIEDGYDDVKEKIRKLINNIQLLGLFDIELIEANGQIFFNELNLRNGAANYAITASGANLPAMLADYVYQNKIPEQLPIKYGKLFVNEKVGLDDYISKACTWQDYCKDKSMADIHFILDGPDTGAVRAFKMLELKNRIRRIVKG